MYVCMHVCIHIYIWQWTHFRRPRSNTLRAAQPSKTVRTESPCTTQIKRIRVRVYIYIYACAHTCMYTYRQYDDSPTEHVQHMFVSVFVSVYIYIYPYPHTCTSIDALLVRVQSDQVSGVMAKFCGLAGVPGMRIPGLVWASRIAV